uniref:Lycopene biosynthesis-enhancing protein n=1 Tax=Tetrahymena thermophila TaxID=5911 RepID=Q8WQI1_TETTH|nr:lycopene biosynthesis-enhancing protein [Tetrahymena thermophila]
MIARHILKLQNLAKTTPFFRFSEFNETESSFNHNENRPQRVQKPRFKKVAIILSGCGVYDGSEVTEVVSLMVHLNKSHVSFQCFAPNQDQLHVVNHITGETTTETRNVLVESARIARGEVKDITQLKGEDYQAVLLPGGFGAAKNLSDYAVNGTNFTVNSEVERVLRVILHINSLYISLKLWLLKIYNISSFIISKDLNQIIKALTQNSKLHLLKNRNSTAKRSLLVLCALVLQFQLRFYKTKNLKSPWVELITKTPLINTGLIVKLSMLLKHQVLNISKEMPIDSKSDFENKIVTAPAMMFNGFTKFSTTFDGAGHLVNIIDQIVQGNSIKLDTIGEKKHENFDGERRPRGQYNRNNNNRRPRENNNENHEQHHHHEQQ